MKKNKVLLNMLMAVFAVVVILATAKGISLSNKTNESNTKELKAVSSAPAVLDVTSKSFAAQPNGTLKTSLPSELTLNKQFDYEEEGGVEKDNVTFFPIIYITSEGEEQNDVVYCTDFSKYTPTSDTGFVREKAGAALSYLASTGKNGKHGTFDAEDERDYYATQVAIHDVLGSINYEYAYDNLTSGFASTMESRITSLIAGAKAATFDVTLSSTGTKTLSKVAGENYYESGLVTVTATQKNPQITLTTNFSGAQILNASGNVISGPIEKGTQIKIRVPESNLTTGSNEIVINASISATIDQAYTYRSSDDDVQPVLFAKTYEESATGSGNMTFTANKQAPTYSIDILKVDSSDAALAGATLVVKDSNGVVKQQWESTTQKVTVSNLLAGDYTIEEINPPEGYRKAADVPFSLPADNGITKKVVNVLAPISTYSIKILKTDQDNAPLAGATLAIIDLSNNTEVKRFTSTTNTITISDLVAGNYTIKEIEAPSGYNKGADVPFSLPDDHGVTKKVVNNIIPKYNVKILKTDQDDAPLAGAILAVIDLSDNSEVQRFTSTKSAITISDLKEGNYTIKEVSTPNGYDTSADIPFTLPDKAGQVINVKNIKQPDKVGNITVSKVDQSNAGLAGATITLKDSSGDVVETFESKENETTHTFTDLAIGSYTIEETKVPVGYRKSENISVTVVDGQTVTKEIVNTLTSVKIIKTDETNDPLAGAQLEIVNSKGDVVYEWTTDNTGEHVINGIPIGSYKLREKAAPTGYAKSDAVVDFTVQHTSATPDITFKNYKTIVKISKVDNADDKLISGANLVVKNSEGETVKSFVSDGKVFEIHGLVVGKYTIEETTPPNGYALLKDKVEFEIKADTTVVSVKVGNDKLVTVPSTSAAASTILLVLGFLFITCGGAFIYYYVKTPQNL